MEIISNHHKCGNKDRITLASKDGGLTANSASIAHSEQKLLFPTRASIRNILKLYLNVFCLFSYFGLEILHVSIPLPNLIKLIYYFYEMG